MLIEHTDFFFHIHNILYIRESNVEEKEKSKENIQEDQKMEEMMEDEISLTKDDLK